MKTMKELGAEQARRHLPKLLDQAHRGEATIITKHGKPYAALVPLSAIPPEVPVVSVFGLRGSAKHCWSDQPNKDINDIREDWD